MARKSEDWTLRRDTRTGNWIVYFRWGGRRYNRSTRTADLRSAQARAASIHEAATAGRRLDYRTASSGTHEELEILVAKWLHGRGAEAAPETVTMNQDHMRAHVLPFFSDIGDFTRARAADYTRARLRMVRAATVKKELSTIRVFLDWCEEQQVIAEVPTIKNPKKKALGTPAQTRRLVVLNSAQLRDFWQAMPERTPRGNHARAFFTVMCELGFRRKTLRGLEVPRHYRKGRKTLTITADIDKNRIARRIPLPPLSRRALDSACDGSEGLIFGTVCYRTLMRRVAHDIGLPDDDAKALSYHDLRHSVATHLGNYGDAKGLQELLGHKHLATTSKYVHTREEDVRRLLDRAQIDTPPVTPCDEGAEGSDLE